jgi:hypothetical protein
MTLTFKDSDGVECRVLFEPVGGDAYYPTTDDLTRAGFVRLATGSDGPTVEQLSALYHQSGRVVVSPNTSGFSPEQGFCALFAAGATSREAAILTALSEAFGERKQPFTSLAEVRESVRGFMIALRKATDESEAAKAEVDRLTADAEWLREQFSESEKERTDTVKALLKALNPDWTAPLPGSLLGCVDRLVEERDSWMSSMRQTAALVRERDAELAATKEEAEKWRLGMQENCHLRAKLADVERELADAAKSAEYLAGRYNRTSEELERAQRVVEAAQLVAAAPSEVNVRLLGLALRIASAAPAADRTEAPKCCFACGDRLMTVWFAPEFCDEQCARDWSDALPEPPRAEAGESGPVCLTCGGAGWAYVAPLPGEPAGETVDCPRCASEESKPEPQPSAPEPSASVPRSEVLRLVDAARREPLSPAESFLADAVELLAKGEVKSG